MRLPALACVLFALLTVFLVAPVRAQPRNPRTVTQESGFLSAPQPRAPANGTVLPGLGPVRLSWDLPAGATQYQVQIRPANGDGPGLNLIRNAESAFSLPAPVLGQGPYVLLPDMGYSWRVRATDKPSSVTEEDPAWGLWSEEWAFRTPRRAGAGFQAVFPANGAVLPNATPVTLRWRYADPAVFYFEIQVSGDKRFDTSPTTATSFVWWNIVHGGASSPANSWQSPTLEFGNVYYWRMRPRVQGDGTPVEWSTPFSFHVPPPLSSLDPYVLLMDAQAIGSAREKVRAGKAPNAILYSFRCDRTGTSLTPILQNRSVDVVTMRDGAVEFGASSGSSAGISLEVDVLDFVAEVRYVPLAGEGKVGLWFHGGPATHAVKVSSNGRLEIARVPRSGSAEQRLSLITVPVPVPEPGKEVRLGVASSRSDIVAYYNGQELARVTDPRIPLTSGGIRFSVEGGPSTPHSVRLTEFDARNGDGQGVGQRTAAMPAIVAADCDHELTALRRAIAELQRNANAALADGTFSVTRKRQPAPSGDPHDYMSLGPYSWPNPDTADGLPYVNRDGQHNPEADDRDRYDGRSLTGMVSAVERLALASYLTDSQAYAGQAALLLRTWFLDPATRMNPNLRYAQIRPGRPDVRSGTGIIDSPEFMRIVDAVGLLQGSGAWTSADMVGLQEWFREFVDWLRTSPDGKAEERATNNHGSWYDAQLADFAIFIGNDELAAQVISASAARRLFPQVAPDGRQPHELARTRSLSYSAFNLKALCILATIGDRLGIDLWHAQRDDGTGINVALGFLIPFIDGTAAWPYQQITPFDSLPLLGPVLTHAAAAYPDGQYGQVLDRLILAQAGQQPLRVLKIRLGLWSP